MSRHPLPQAIAGVVLVAGLLTGCAPSTGTASQSSTGSSTAAAKTAEPSTLAPVGESRSGDFEGLNGKTVAGTATVDGTTVDLSGFSSDEGPDLHLYLTNGTDEKAVSAGLEIGEVSFDTATQSFSVENAGDYGYVVVHCDKAKAVFGAAKLS